jgi:hypothetical protein
VKPKHWLRLAGTGSKRRGEGNGFIPCHAKRAQWTLVL